MSSRVIVHAIPTFLVFVGLAGTAWWGHRNGWTMPFSAASKNGSAKPQDDWCEAHSVPESICIECDTSLLPRPAAFGWCQVHGVHDCPWCHPEVAQLTKPYQVTEADRERAKRALAAERPENSKNCKLHQRRLQFASIEAVEKAGIDVNIPVTRAAIKETIPVYGEIIYDPGRIAHLSSRSAGTVAKVYKHLGDRVEQGDVLALVDAGEVGKAKAEFLQATLQIEVKQKALELARGLAQTGVGDQTAVTNADAALRETKLRLLSARQSLINLGLPRSPADFKLLAEDFLRGAGELELAKQLHFLGIPPDLRAGFDRETHSSNLMPLRTPIRGVVVSRDMVSGEIVDSTHTLFEIVDTSRLWLSLDVRAEDVAKIELGSKVFFKPDGQHKQIEGAITSISTEADAKTRTVKVRTELDNSDGKLRANTFGSGRIVLREEPEAIVVPSTAVHWEGDCHVVFVRDKNWLTKGSFKVLHTRVVRVGMSDGKITEIIAGLLPGEIVAANGSEILRAELLRSNFGEGCACCQK